MEMVVPHLDHSPVVDVQERWWWFSAAFCFLCIDWFGVSLVFYWVMIVYKRDVCC